MVEIQYIDSQFILVLLTMVWFIFAYLCEWKKDPFYSLFSTLLSVEMTLQYASINIMFTIVFFMSSIYFSVLFMFYLPFIKPYLVKLMDKLQIGE